MKLTCKNVCILYAVFWVFSALYMMRPTSFETDRLVKEYTFWLKFSMWSYSRAFSSIENWNPLHAIVGDESTYPRKDPELEYRIYTPEEFSLEMAAEDTNNFDIPFLVKGFAKDLLEPFEYDFIMKNFTDDIYPFEVGNVVTNVTYDGKPLAQKFKKYTFQEGMQKMKETQNLYLRFSNTLAKHNPYFDKALVDSIARLGPMFKPLVGDVGTANRLCFIGWGEKSKTKQHVAITDNWFLQVSGRKRWVILPPSATPYMKPHFVNTIALGSLLPLYKESMGIQAVEMISEPGDLLYFPGWWWHEVNNEGEMNFGCGIRPRESVLRLVKSLAFPPSTFPKGSFGIYLAIWPDAIRTISKNFNINLSVLWDWKKGFAADRHQEWWASEEDKSADKSKNDL